MTDGYKTSSTAGWLRIILQEPEHVNGEALYKWCRGRICDETNAHRNVQTGTVVVPFVVKAHLKGKCNIFSEDQLNNDTMSSVQEQIWNSLKLVLTYDSSGPQK